MDDPPPLRRRNSIATSVFLPTKLTFPTETPFHTSSLPPLNCNCNCNDVVSFELGSFKSSSSSLSYTSLKDILPSSAVNSPTAAAATSTYGSTYEISIRNRLVKQAAWAYLQPMSSSPGSSSQHFLRRLWLRLLSENPITACFRFITHRLIPSITQVFDRIIRVIRVQMSR